MRKRNVEVKFRLSEAEYAKLVQKVKDSGLNRNAFLVSDSIFIILDPDINSALGANVFYELWEKKRKNLFVFQKEERTGFSVNIGGKTKKVGKNPQNVRK